MNSERASAFVPNQGDYRALQAAWIPGVEGLYQALQAVLDSTLAPQARVLVVGAGGGREIEALGASAQHYTLVGVDPYEPMLDLARPYAVPYPERVTLIQGTVDDLPASEPFDAATSMLVLHMLPDDGPKLRYLQSLRARLRPGAALVHAEISLDTPHTFNALAPVAERYAQMVGVPEGAAAWMLEFMTKLATVPEHRMLELMRQSGFELVAPLFRGLWYACWWLRAV